MRKMLALLKGNRDNGFTLVEVLVTVFLTALVLATVTAAILTTRNSVNKFTESTATQESLTNATASIARELAVSPTFVTADDYQLHIINADGEHFRYVYYDPANPSVKLSDGIDGKGPKNVPNLDVPSFLEMRTYKGENYSTITVLVSDVNMKQHDNGLALFTYYNQQNQVMQTPVAEKSLGQIKRIAIRIVGNTESRAQPLEVVTSLTPNSGQVAGAGNDPERDSPLATVLRGTLPRPTQDATLTWVHVAGATSYVLYRDGAAIATLSSDQELKYVDKSRPWGTTQVYSVVASGPGGLSPESNKISLTVVPQKPTFINVRPLAACEGSTVARDLDNCLIWAARSGATGYKVYRGSELIYQGTALSYVDSGRNYGDITSYTLIAYNTGQNGSGGDSITSDPVSLISPPVAPRLVGSHLNGTRNLNWNMPGITFKYTLLRDTPTPFTWNIASGATTSLADKEAVEGASFTYRIRAGNDAGWGPYSDTVTILPRPAAPNLAGQDFGSHPNTRDGNNYVSWAAVPNATCYEWRRDDIGTVNRVTGTSFTDSGPGWGTNRTYSVRSCNITGPSAWSSITLRQGPAPFGITGVSQAKRLGQYPLQAGSQDDWGFREQSMNLSWGGSAGAAYYNVYRGGGHIYQGGATSIGVVSNPGYAEALEVHAVSGNGLARSSGTWGFQTAPAQIKTVATRAQSTNSATSRTVFWGEAVPVVGRADGVQQQTLLIEGTRITWAANWANWTGSMVSTPEWDKSKSSLNTWVGGMQFQRTYVNIPGGYSAGGVDGGNWGATGAKGSGWQPDGSGNYSWSTIITFRAYGPGYWQGSFNGQWKDVPYHTLNYSMSGGRDYEQIFAR